jgi:hypothetical protein
MMLSRLAGSGVELEEKENRVLVCLLILVNDTIRES